MIKNKNNSDKKLAKALRENLRKRKEKNAINKLKNFVRRDSTRKEIDTIHVSKSSI